MASPPFAGRAAFPRPGHRSAFLDRYSLHADRLVDAEDREGLERLCRYGARSPIANSRLSRDPAGRVVMALKRPLRDGRTELAFTPVEFLRRLATLIPPPRAHLTAITACSHPTTHSAPPSSDSTVSAEVAGSRAGPLRRLAWAALMKRVFAIDVLVCDTCGGAMRILAVLAEGDASRAILPVSSSSFSCAPRSVMRRDLMNAPSGCV